MNLPEQQILPLGQAPHHSRRKLQRGAEDYQRNRQVTFRLSTFFSIVSHFSIRIGETSALLDFVPGGR